MYRSTSTAISLRDALETVGRDRGWPLKCLLYGALALSVAGLPVAAGFVLESLDNSRKGFPTPLPPWSDWSLRWLSGLLSLLIDFVFFVLPLLAGIMLIICVSIGLLIAGQTDPALVSRVLAGVAILCGLFILAMFLSSVSPAGRLLFIRDGRVEDALSMRALRWATSPGAGALFLRARLLSLPAYLPAALIALAGYGLSLISFPAQGIALALLVWLLLSALVFAHLVAVQLYVAVDRAI